MTLESNMRRLIFVLSILAAWPAYATEMNAGQLLNYCSQKDFFCNGFIYGITEMPTTMPEGTFKFCVGGRGNGEVVDAVTKWMNVDFLKYPDDRNTAAIAMVVGILMAQYPCK